MTDERDLRKSKVIILSLSFKWENNYRKGALSKFTYIVISYQIFDSKSVKN